MAEITQRLGFEAAGAIATLNQLNSAIGSVNRQLNTFNKRTGALNSSKVIQGFNQVTTSASTADRALQSNAQNFRKTGQAGQQASTNITASWETMLRVVQTQLIVRALSRVIELFGESADAAGEFELAIGRTAAIARGPAGEMNALAESSRRLAIELGRTQDEVNEAAYEALQNDLGTTAETMDLVRGAANDLSLVTGTDLTNSVNALSSILKIYNLDVDEADRVSSVLFGTIDSGRVTMDDLASSLGSVGPFASQLSVELEELGAAIAAITLQGVNSSRAQTQLRGVFNALLKPTNALKDAFEELGVVSGRDLIETSGGLVEALQALEELAGDNEQKFAAFFGRIRGQAGALNILNNNASNAVRILDELQTNTTRAADEAEKLDNLDVRNYDRALARLRDTLLSIGEATQQIRTISVNWLNIMIAGFGELFGLTDNFTRRQNAVRSGFEGLEEVAQQNAERFNQESEKLVEARFERETQHVREFAREVSREYQALASVVEDRQGQIARTVTRTTENFANSISSIISEVEGQITGLTDVIAELEQGARDAAEEAAELEFERSLRSLSELRRFQARLNRLIEEEAELRRASRDATADPASLERLAKEEADVRRRAEELVREARETGDIRLIERAEKRQIESLRTIESAERNAAQNVAALREELDSQRGRELQNQLLEVGELAEDAIDLDLADPDAIREFSQSLRSAFDEIDTDLLRDLGLEEQLRDSISRFGRTLNQARFEWTGAVESLQEALQAERFQAAVDLQISDTGDVNLDELFAGVASETDDPGQAVLSQLGALLNLRKQNADAQREVQTQTTLAQRALEGFRQSIVEASDSAGRGFLNINNEVVSVQEFVNQRISQLIDLQSRVVRATSEQRGQLGEEISGLETTLGGLEEAGLISGRTAAALGSALENARQLNQALGARQEAGEVIDEDALDNANRQLQEGKTNVDGLRGSMRDVQTSSTSAANSAKQIPPPLRDADGAARQIGPGVLTALPAMNAAIARANALRAAMLAAAAAARQAAAAGPQNAYHGGKIAFRAGGGGISRGQDTVPAMLSPGEFVVNSRSANQFAAQLQAINANQQPQFRDQGGSVTNVGDINVSVQTDSTQGVSGRDIAAALRRELRRETSSL